MPITDLQKRIRSAERRSGSKARALLKKVIKDYPSADKINWGISKGFGSAVGLLGATSAKVRHSMEAQEWYNVVMYLSPADRAMISFIVEYPDLVRPLEKNLRKAAASDKKWKSFTSNSRKSLQAVIRQIQVARKGPPKKDHSPVGAENRYTFLSSCPHASAMCRAVCLNVSGKGEFPLTSKARKMMLEGMVEKGLNQRQFSLSDDLEYMYLRGVKAFYAGEQNSVQAYRTRRTHLMWICWALYGVIKNPFNDLLREEAMIFHETAKAHGKRPMALRLNGTSDLPVETLKTTDGKYLVDELGKKGIICYDYTKHYGKMSDWISSKAWSGTQKPLRGQIRRVKGFPSNYYLCFSWSEKNGAQALDVLKRGANVVMVFKRSAQSTRETGLPPKARAKGAFPKNIPIPQLTDRKVDTSWVASVIDGDHSDLRFLDPTTFKPMDGKVVGLIIKGRAGKKYTVNEREKLWKKFTLTGIVDEKGSLLLRSNPSGKDLSAVNGTDPDILKQMQVKIGGYQISTTASGT